MKKLMTCLGLSCSVLIMSAQSGIIATRPANSGSEKLLTMEETILSRELSPENVYYGWDADGELKQGPMPTETLPQTFYKGKSLWLREKDGSERPIAESTDPSVTYGQYVSRNEFGIDGGVFWSPDSTKIAFYAKDESKVSMFPLLDITTRTGSLKEIPYPMAGMDSELISLMIHDLKSGNTFRMEHECAIDPSWERKEETYLTNICWSPDSENIFIQMLDRSQKHVRLCMYDISEASMKVILTEDNDRYVEPLDPLYFIKGHDDIFIYRTANRHGYRNLYLCNTDGDIRRLTETDADVSYVANDGKYVYYTSAEVSPIENHLFRIELKKLGKGVSQAVFRKPQRLTQATGWHNIRMSPDCSRYIDSWSSLYIPRVVDLCKADGKIERNLLTASDPTLGHAYTEISLGTIKSADGQYDNYYRLIKPKDFDPEKKYPVIVYVYGGPHSQMVQNTFLGLLRRWEMYMAQRGYIVYVQDNRGTQNRGLAFEQAIHGRCGKAEMEDQMEGVRMLMELPYVDTERIGVHGWSYGGFMTISLMTNYPEVFKVGVAGGPVIDWKWYEVMYGERYMDHPEKNPEGYSQTSLINMAPNLKGKLLICQGAVDPVVVWEHSLSFIRECIKNNIQVDYFPYPCAEHNVMGKDRVHLHDKISMYFEDYL